MALPILSFEERAFASVTFLVNFCSNAAASGGIRRNTYMVTVGGLAFAIIVGTYRRFTCEKRSKKQSLDLDSTYILDDSADSYQMSELSSFNECHKLTYP